MKKQVWGLVLRYVIGGVVGVQLLWHAIESGDSGHVVLATVFVVVALLPPLSWLRRVVNWPSLHLRSNPSGSPPDTALPDTAPPHTTVMAAPWPHTPKRWNDPSS